MTRTGPLSTLIRVLRRRQGHGWRQNVAWFAREIARRLDPTGEWPREPLPQGLPTRGRRVVHVINPVAVAPRSGLGKAQDVTFSSIERALRHAREAGVEVEVWGVGFPEDQEVVPDHVAWKHTLARSGLDLQHFEVERKLPLLGDILKPVSTLDPDTTVVYSNIDIAIMPSFYTVVAAIAEERDGFIVNRRSIPDQPAGTPLPILESHLGASHPGFDCFAFRAASYDAMDLRDVVVGIPYVGQVLALNMAAHADGFHVFRDTHLTYHLGDDRSWEDRRLADWLAHNRGQFEQVHAALAEQYVVPDVEACMGLESALPRR